MTADTTPDTSQVPLRQRSIPDQLDYLGDKLAAQMDTQTVPRDALIAMGAAIVNMGHIAMVLRQQGEQKLRPEFGIRAEYISTRSVEGAVADTLDGAQAALEQFDAKYGAQVVKRTLIRRPVGDWEDVSSDG